MEEGMEKVIKKGKLAYKGITILIILFIVALICGKSLVETVEKGTYQIKQAAVTGTMSAKMTPGMWG